MEKKQIEKKAVQEKSLIEQYTSQTKKDEDIHFEHFDWTYSDGSGCCC